MAAERGLYIYILPLTFITFFSLRVFSRKLAPRLQWRARPSFHHRAVGIYSTRFGVIQVPLFSLSRKLACVYIYISIDYLSLGTQCSGLLECFCRSVQFALLTAPPASRVFDMQTRSLQAQELFFLSAHYRKIVTGIQCGMSSFFSMFFPWCYRSIYSFRVYIIGSCNTKLLSRQLLLLAFASSRSWNMNSRVGSFKLQQQYVVYILYWYKCFVYFNFRNS